MDIKRLFFKPEDNGGNNAAQPQVQVNSTPITQTSAQDSPVVNTQSTSVVSNEYVEKLWEKVNESNLEGNDYLEYNKMVESMKSNVQDDELCRRLAFIALQNTDKGFTIQTIASSLDTYIGVVNSERQVGLNQLAAIRLEKVDNRERDVEELKEKADRILKEIDRLRAEYDKITSDIININSEISSARSKLQLQESDFNRSVEYVINMLNSEKEKILKINV